MVKQRELDLLEELRTGDEVAFKRVYDDNREKFLLFANRYGLSEAERIDIYQDAYITFYQNVTSGKLKELRSALSTYLFGIGKFLIMKKLKKNKRSIRSEYALSIAQNEDVDFDKLEWDEEPLTHEQQLLKEYFKTLGEKCQKLLTMFYYRGLSIDEIIVQGGYNNANVVKSQKSRCLKTLRERILKPQSS